MRKVRMLLSFIGIEAKETLIDSLNKQMAGINTSLDSQIKLYETFKHKYEEIAKYNYLIENYRENEIVLNEKNEYQKMWIGFDEVKKERNERIKMLQDRLTSVEFQNNFNEK